MKAFVSYPSEKLDVAREVYRLLKSVGVDAWLDKENLVMGDNWAREIRLALQATDMVVLVCSKEVISKAGVIQREIRQALDLLRDKPPGHIFLLPLRVDDIHLPEELTALQYSDYFRPGWQVALVRSVKKRLEQVDQPVPQALEGYLSAYERNGGVQFRTLRRGFADFAADADYFVYQGGGEYWEFLTAEIVTDVVGGYYEAAAFATSMGAVDRRIPDYTPVIGMSWSRRFQEYFRDDEFVSLQCDAWQFFRGAHGTRGVYTKNYGGREVGRLVSLRQVLNYQASAVVREYCTQAVKGIAGYDAEVADDLDRRWRETLDPWEPFSQWLFNREGVRIWFSMYSGLPYVFGVFDVSIPWSHLRPHIDDDFRNTAFGRFVASC